MPRGRLGSTERTCAASWGGPGACEVRSRDAGKPMAHFCTWIVRKGEELHRHNCAKCTARSAMMKPPTR
jgi:hypothetical protein